MVNTLILLFCVFKLQTDIWKSTLEILIALDKRKSAEVVDKKRKYSRHLMSQKYKEK